MLALFFSLLLSSNLSNSSGRPALPLRYSIERDVSSDLHQQLTGLLSTALKFVREFPPNGYENNLFSWSERRKLLKGKSFQINLTTSKNSKYIPLMNGLDERTSIDSFTIAPINPGNKTMSIHLVLLVDRIFFDDSGRELQHGLSKLVVALAHEIYGNVQQLLKFDIEDARPQKVYERVLRQRRSSRASLMFLSGIKNNKDFSKMPANIQEGLMSLLPLEEESFRFWQKVNPTMELDPVCEAMLKSILAERKK